MEKLEQLVSSKTNEYRGFLLCIDDYISILTNRRRREVRVTNLTAPKDVASRLEFNMLENRIGHFCSKVDAETCIQMSYEVN